MSCHDKAPLRSGIDRRRLLPLSSLLIIPLFASMPGCAEFFLLHPNRHAIETPHGVMLGRLHAVVVEASDRPGLPSATAYIGNASRAEYAAPRWASTLHDLVAEVVAVNYPGYGKSAGDADLDALVPTAIEADRAFPRPVLIGNSMGSAVALAVAADRAPTRLLILQNVPPLRDLILERYGWWNLWLLALPVAFQIPRDLDAIENAKRCTAPAIFLSATDDRTVPASYQQEVIDAYAGPKRVIRYDGGHNARLSTEVIELLREAVAQELRASEPMEY